MKALYIGLNFEYINPTEGLIPLVLRKVFNEIIFWGPGYQESSKLNMETLAKFISEVDVVVFREHAVFWPQSMRYRINWYKKYAFARFEYNVIKDFLAMVNFSWKETDNYKILMMPSYDYYGISRKEIEFLEDFVSNRGVIVCWGNEFFKFKDELPVKSFSEISNSINDNFKNFLIKNTSKIISFPHFVGEHEFCFVPLHNRKYLIAIPGTTAYYRRKKAKVLLQNSRFKYFKNWHVPIWYILSKLGLPVFGNFFSQKGYQLCFRYCLENTKYLYTEGSLLDWPIRKFFEIPAAGALLLATPCTGFEHLGFKDMVNCVVMTPEELLDKVSFLEKNYHLAQKITNKGRDLVWEKHTVDARVFQLRSCLMAISKGIFKGSRWENGEFVIC